MKTMRHRILLLPLLLAMAAMMGASSIASSIGGISSGGGRYHVVFLDEARGRETLALYDAELGMLTVALNASTSDPEYKYVPVRRYGYFDGKFLRAEDLTGDGAKDLLLPGYSANRMFVLRSDQLGVRAVELEELFVGAGPEAVAGGQLDGRPGHEVLVATTAGRSLAVRAWNFVSMEPASGPADFPVDFAAAGLLGFETAAASSVQFIPDVDDEVLVVFENGSIELFDFTPGSGFTLNQHLDPPAGMRFALAAGGNAKIFALAANGDGQLALFNLYEKNGAEYGLVSQGMWPAAPLLENHVTVVLYTADPFASPPPFPFETFVAGDWATRASFSGGTVTAEAGSQALAITPPTLGSGRSLLCPV